VPPAKRSILPDATQSRDTSMATLFLASAFSVLGVLLAPCLFDLFGWRQKA
jgi:hypothetical protein